MVTTGLHRLVTELIPPRRDKGIMLNVAAENWMPAPGMEDCEDWDPAEKNYEIYNCDLLRRPLPNLKVCDLNLPWPYPSEWADVILSVEVIEHLENPWHHFREVKRVLKPGGVLILTIPNILAPVSLELWPYFNWFGPNEWDISKHIGHINPMPIFEFRLICQKLRFRMEKELYHPPESKINLVLVVRKRK